jgi:methyl coenzyme M reductase subunit C-like uncharacterized protein (methanogenesis marker protein 7)
MKDEFNQREYQTVVLGALLHDVGGFMMGENIYWIKITITTLVTMNNISKIGGENHERI